MNPTSEQLANRLNPTAVNLNVPGEGSVFRSEVGDVIFMIKDGQLQRFSIAELGFQAEQAAGRLRMTPGGWDGPATGQPGGLKNAGISELKRLYGIDWSAIPTKPEGQIADLSGLVRDGKLKEGGTVDLNQAKTALSGTPGQATSVTVNNTPNTLADTLGKAASGILPPSVNLQPGARGEDVKQLQTYLQSQGIDPGPIDGIYGAKTTAAVKALQEKLGVDNSSGVGYFGPKTIGAIRGTGGSSSSGMTAEQYGTGGWQTMTEDERRVWERENNYNPSRSYTGTSPMTEAERVAAIDKAIGQYNLTPDQVQMIKALGSAVSTQDIAKFNQFLKAFDTMSTYSNPYFKAQVLIATDALKQNQAGNATDLAFREQQHKQTVDQLNAQLIAMQGTGSFQDTQDYKNLITHYDTELENTRQNLATSGFTSSSIRGKSDKLLAEQNQGLIESGTRKFSYDTGQIKSGVENAGTLLAYYKDKNTQANIDALRKTEGIVGTNNLSGYSGLLGVGDNAPISGELLRQKTAGDINQARSFVFG